MDSRTAAEQAADAVLEEMRGVLMIDVARARPFLVAAFDKAIADARAPGLGVAQDRSTELALREMLAERYALGRRVGAAEERARERGGRSPEGCS